MDGNSTMLLSKLKQTGANKGAVITAGTAIFLVVHPMAASIPSFPTFLNPGRFTLIDSWTNKERGINKIQGDLQ